MIPNSTLFTKRHWKSCCFCVCCSFANNGKQVQSEQAWSPTKSRSDIFVLFSQDNTYKCLWNRCTFVERFKRMEDNKPCKKMVENWKWSDRIKKTSFLKTALPLTEKGLHLEPSALKLLTKNWKKQKPIDVDHHKQTLYVNLYMNSQYGNRKSVLLENINGFHCLSVWNILNYIFILHFCTEQSFRSGLLQYPIKCARSGPFQGGVVLVCIIR